MTTNDKNTQRFIVKLANSEHFCTPYTCVQKGEVICLCFSSVHLPSPLPPYFRFPYSAYHPSRLQQPTKCHPTTLKIEHKFDMYYSRNFSSTSESNVTFFQEKRIRTLNSGRHIWVWNRLRSVLGPLGSWNIAPRVWGVWTVGKTYFSDNDNEKGKYSDENSPIRSGCGRVEDIKGRACAT